MRLFSIRAITFNKLHRAEGMGSAAACIMVNNCVSTCSAASLTAPTLFPVPPAPALVYYYFMIVNNDE